MEMLSLLVQQGFKLLQHCGLFAGLQDSHIAAGPEAGQKLLLGALHL